MFRLVPHENIDFKKWDGCISNSPQSLVYVNSWYLNAIAGKWDALIANDYEVVFPLIHNSRLNFKYIYQPLGMHQVAACSPNIPASSVYNEILNYLSENYTYIDINLKNEHVRITQPMMTQSKVFQVLKMKNRSHSEISNNYSSRHKYSIRKAVKAGVKATSNISMDELEQVFRASTLFDDVQVYRKGFPILKNLMNACIDRGYGQIWGAQYGAQLISVSFIIGFKKRLYYLFVSATNKARELCANHLVTDTIIKTNLPTFDELDFVGSNHPSIAFYNRGYGAEDRYYLNVKTGNLFPLIDGLQFVKNAVV